MYFTGSWGSLKFFWTNEAFKTSIELKHELLCVQMKHSPLLLLNTLSLLLFLFVFLSFLALKHPLTPFNTVLCSAQPQSNSAKNSIVTSPKGNVPSPALVFTSLFLSVLSRSIFLSDWSVVLASFFCLTHVCLCQRLARLRPPVVDAVCLLATSVQAHLHLCHRNNVNVIIDELHNPDMKNFDGLSVS